MRRAAWLILSIALLVATACRSTPGTRPAAATPVPRTGDSVGEAYRLLIGRSVGQVSASNIATAGVQGIRLALMADGVVPPEVATPTFTDDATADATLLHTSIQTAETHYASK